jgi:WD40 repeat protein
VHWNYEIPWLLISGGDDSQIAIWDIRKNKLLFDAFEPCISTSSFTSHPKKPFTLISSHLDNSLIFWDLLGLPDIISTQLKFLLDVGLVETICDAHDQMAPSVKGKLSGDASRSLATSLKKMNKFDRFVSILKFFN